jgi:excisionase family DNA binding protein
MQEGEGNKEHFLTADEAADFLRVSRSWIFKLTSARAIPHIHMGRRVLFDREELYEWAKQRRVPTAKEEVENEAQ